MKKQNMVMLSLIYITMTSLLAAEAQWHKELNGNFTASQVALDNWSAGGEDSLSWRVDIFGKLNKKFSKGKWNNSGKVSYGLTKSGSLDARKSYDELRYNSLFTFNSKRLVAPYASFSFLSQLAEGKDFSSTPATIVSYSFDPAYFTQSIGFAYTYNDALSTRAGIALKQTVVNKSTIVISASETGIEAAADYNKQLNDTTKYTMMLQAFNAGEELKATDIYWDNSLLFALSKSVNANFNLNMIYDRDISTKKQLKQSFGIGVVYNFIK